MVKHIVFWKLKEDRKTEENKNKMRMLLTGLVGKVSGLKLAEVGFNFNPDGYDVALYSVFESKEALEEYQKHPEHLEVKKFVHSVIEARAVADYDI